MDSYYYYLDHLRTMTRICYICQTKYGDFIQKNGDSICTYCYNNNQEKIRQHISHLEKENTVKNTEIEQLQERVKFLEEKENTAKNTEIEQLQERVKFLEDKLKALNNENDVQQLLQNHLKTIEALLILNDIEVDNTN